MQEAGYFENHPCYGGLRDVGHNDIDKIERFFTLSDRHIVVIIGCGYGREAAHIGNRVRLIYGVDVNATVLSKAVAYLAQRGVANFRPVLAERHESDIPAPVDLVYAVTVMQHLTCDLVLHYLQTMAGKLSAGGRMIIQFMETDAGENDAAIAVYEPSVSWSREQIAEAAASAELRVLKVHTEWIRAGCAWHWAYLAKA